MSSRYKAHYDTLVHNGVPPEIAAKAAEVTANETGKETRTPQQQQVVTEAWHYLAKRQGSDGEK